MGRVFLEKEALVVFWGGDLPDYLEDRDWDLMPESVKVVSSEIHYMLWVVAFDFTQAEPGYEMEGFIRWRSVPPGVQSIIMFEDQLTISAASPFFYQRLLARMMIQVSGIQASTELSFLMTATRSSFMLISR